MDTQTQIDRLIELAIVQRAELKALVEQLPQLREYLGTEIEKTFEQVEPQLRGELEEFCNKRTEEFVEALRGDVSEQVGEILKTLETAAAAKYSALMAERERNAELEKKAEHKIAEAAAALPSQVKEIVTAELARFPRAGEIDQLRKEFAEPKSLNPRGKWVAGETYNKLDLVTINGDSYVSNIDGNTEKPSRSAGNWTLNAARGNSGGGGGITALNDLLGNPSAGDIVGSEGNNYVRKTLTAGTGITITDDPSTITIDASGAQEILTATVKNAESFAITRGQVVYLFGATGGFASVKLASNTSDATSAKTFGVVSDASIAANGTGIITCVGVQDKLMLGAYNDGDTLYLGATAGSVTNIKPYAPNHLVYVGIVERANNGNGELYVKIQNGYELDEIHDVQINSPKLAGQTLIYDATTDLWKNARLTAGVGVSISNGDSAITISADGGVNYQGTWNAATNTPTLTSSVGTKGFYYVVSVAGSTNLNGVTDWKVGDWAIFNGTAWEKVDTTDQVSSVFGRTGAVVGVSTDYSSVGITNTAIGASNPSTGAFTSLSATGNLTVSGTGTFGGVLNVGGSTASPTGATTSLNLNTTTANWEVGRNNTAGGFYIYGYGGAGYALKLADATGNATLAGNLTVNGGTTTITSALNPALYAGVSTTDRLELIYTYDGGGYGAGSYALLQTYGLAPKRMVLQRDGGNILVGGTTDISGSGGLKVFGSTASTSTTSGALQVVGGVGVGGAINAGGNLTVGGSGTVNSPSGTSSGLLVKAFNTAGGNIQQWADFQTSTGLTLARFLRGNGASGYDANGLSIDSYSGLWVNLNALGGSGGTFTIAGGNLTVSGGTITGGASGMSLAAGGTNQNITLTPSGTGNVIAGNSFRVGGTAPADSLAGYTSIELGYKGHALFGGSNDNWWTTNAYFAGGGWKRGANQLVAAINANAGDFIFKQAGAGAADSAITWTDSMTLYRNGNLLIGTTTDSANGKLQLADHSTSAGGIGFGTRISLHSGGTNKLIITDTTGTNPYLEFREGANPKLQLFTLSSTAYLSTVGATPLILRTNETTALTLDSSQNATFAGFATVSKKTTTATQSSFVLGDDLAITTNSGRSKMTLGSTNSVSEILLGQTSSNCLVLQWEYAANVANARGLIGTYGYSNPIAVRASSITLETGGSATTALTITSAQQVQANATTASTSTTTGALVVSGGVGVAGAINAGGNLTVSGATSIGAGLTSNGDPGLQINATSSIGRVIFSRTAGTLQSWQVGTTGNDATAIAFNIDDNTVGATRFKIAATTGLVTIGQNLVVSGTTDSSSTTTGALTVAGGLGVAKAIYGPSCIFPATGAVSLTPSDGYIYFRSGSTAYASWSLDGSTVQLFTENDTYKHIRLRPRSGGSTVINNAAIATTATDGFLYVPTCAGAPTGTPTTQTGTAPIVVDTTNNKLYFYSGGAWRNVGP